MILRWTPRQFGGRSPWREIERLRNQMEGFFDSVSNGVEAFRRGSAGVYPLINVLEDEENIYLSAEIPGVEASELELSVHGDSVTLRGERKIAEAGEEVNYHRRERDSGFFRRVVSLPVKIDADKAEASNKNGVLTVKLPKAAEAKPRQISVAGE